MQTQPGPAAEPLAGPSTEQPPELPPELPAELLADTQIHREVCALVHRLAHTLDVQVREIADALGLTPAQVIALRELTEPITARELARRMYCEPSNATFVLDRLEEQDLVQRRPHEQDRRAKQIVLTPAGQDLRADVLERLRQESPLGPLDDAQRESLRDLLVALDEPR